MARVAKSPLERLQERIRTADRGWFFAAVADKVAERRQEKGRSQRELAELAGTNQAAIARRDRASGRGRGWGPAAPRPASTRCPALQTRGSASSASISSRAASSGWAP